MRIEEGTSGKNQHLGLNSQFMIQFLNYYYLTLNKSLEFNVFKKRFCVLHRDIPEIIYINTEYPTIKKITHRV